MYTLLYEGNEETTLCIQMPIGRGILTKNAQCRGRAKHIDIKYHFIREHVANAEVKLDNCSTDC